MILNIDELTNSIVLGDSLEVLKKLPDESVDVCFADPPFNLKKKYGQCKDNMTPEEYLAWSYAWIDELIRITKPTGSIFILNIPKWLTYYSAYLNTKAVFKHWISWDAPSSPMGKSLQPTHYGILYYTKSKKDNTFYEIRHPHKRCRKCNIMTKDYGGKKSKVHPFGPLVGDVWTDIHRVKHDKYRDNHPCQLPVHLLDRIILMSSDENQIILDPFSGTGSTSLAAMRLGRRYIGIDHNQIYVDIANSKLSKEKWGSSKLGDIYVSYYLNNIITIRDRDWTLLKDYFYIPSDMKNIDKEQIKLLH